jgi:hypothetical protein
MQELLILYEESAVKWVDKICVPAASEWYEIVRHLMVHLLDAETGQ